MKYDIDSLAEKARNRLESLACDYAEVRLSSGSSTSITLSGEEVDSFTSGDSVAGSARVLVNGAWGFVSFNTIDEVESFIAKGCDIASRMRLTEKTRIKPAAPVVEKFSVPIKRRLNDVSMDEKFKLIGSYNSILRSSPLVQTTRATYRDVTGRYVYLNSEGSDLRYDRSYCGVSLVSIAKDGNVIQPFHESVSGYGGFEHAQGHESSAEKVVKTAVDLLKAESVPGGTYRVIADPKLAGVFIHEAFGHLSEADFVYENEQMKKIMVLGKKFGPDELNVYDDGSIPVLSGYIPFDDEGILPQKTALISKGTLSGRLHSRETAAKMDEDVTGNGRAIGVMRQPIVRMTNTYIDNGPHSVDDVFDSVDNGIYAVDVIGGQTNLEMFTFTSGYGYEIKNGKKGKMFKDIVLSGNVFHTLKNIEKIANDKQMFGGLGGCGKGGQSPLPVSFGGPHILINNVLIGGRQ